MSDTLTSRLFRCYVYPSEPGWCVDPVWTNVDRPSTGGWWFPPEERDLAFRLAAAIEDGAVFTSWEIVADIHGNTYVRTENALPSRSIRECLDAMGR